ncbi:DUF4124 domain-containing protein [Vulcaniibacterium tengchongense]|uniref:DUF4124 domain-containing protein n=1 Tax=Vulcaniibacterium tengchongense TaxID=1273429 RepID=A0A3N4VRY8_9GAMM|nr:DUF4124 domain-containing protein [Vulcaniibacterium tengchongense]RPE79837.1 hypothetical protein EDC50_1666 [Vulcaniibacterium tengchongense]
MPRRARIAPRLAAAVLVAATGAAQAQTVIYRCTDAAGRVALQNDRPCPQGSKQETRVIEAPAAPWRALPPATPAPAAAAPVIATPAPAPAAASRVAPPPLYVCGGQDRERYYSEAEQPPSRCVPLPVVGLDGTRATAAGSACQVVQDRCEAVPAEAQCTQWRRYLGELEFKARFAPGGRRPDAQAEAERVRRLLAASLCGD